MSPRPVFHIIAHLLILTAIAMIASLGVSYLHGDPLSARNALALSSIASMIAALLMYGLTKGPIDDLTLKDGIAVVTLGWIAVSVFGALPYVLSGTIRDPVGALFESVSGFTTTGSSVIADVDPLPRGILFWRALTHFIGGMGVLVLCIAVLPFLAVGGMQLYRAEVAGPSKERLTPRLTTTAKYLWGVYVLLILVQTMLLRLGDMSWFDAVCHSFATVATGGFSTRTQSIGAYHSPYIESVVIVFMFLGATNFALHYAAIRGRPLAYFRDPEFRLYLGLWLAACAVVTVDVWKTAHPTLASSIRYGVFNTTSLLCTTGFATADFDLWPATSRGVLLVLMVIGGCVGSTGGGIKQMRALVSIKKTLMRIKSFMYPQAVMQVKMGDTRVDDDVAGQILGFVALYVGALTLASLIMTYYTKDMLTALSSVVANMGGVGPGLARVGPMCTYDWLPAGGKITLILCMLLGRLEFYTVLALLYPSFWRK